MKRLLSILALCLSSLALSAGAFSVTPSSYPPAQRTSRTSWSAPSRQSSAATSSTASSATYSKTRLSMIFGGPKDDGSPGDYVCKDCGYVFTKGPAAWAALPSDYSCPPCGAAKWRFAKVPKGSANSKGGGAKPGASAAPAKRGLFG